VSALTATLFIEEDTSPLVYTIGSVHPYEVIRFGRIPAVFTLFTDGGDAEALDYWDRLRRACVEAIDRTQRRLDAAASEVPDLVPGPAPVFAMDETIEDAPLLQAQYERMVAEATLVLEDDLAGAEAAS
jgi:hypothetical protein